jgi:hypothetical protein
MIDVQTDREPNFLISRCQLTVRVLQGALSFAPARHGGLEMPDPFTLHHVSLYMRDVDASAAFYADVLGLQEILNRVGKSHIEGIALKVR